MVSGISFDGNQTIFKSYHIFINYMQPGRIRNEKYFEELNILNLQGLTISSLTGTLFGI